MNTPPTTASQIAEIRARHDAVNTDGVLVSLMIETYFRAALRRAGYAQGGHQADRAIKEFLALFAHETQP